MFLSDKKWSSSPMTTSDQLHSYIKVKNKLRTAQHRVEEYLDFMIEIKRFLDVSEDRSDDLRDIELLADKLLKVLYEFEDNEEEDSDKDSSPLNAYNGY
jgi:hypothetical protein